MRISGHYVAYVGNSSNDEMHLSLGDAMENVKDFNEYGPLLQEHREIVAEHERLESHPFDRQAHEAHRRRLIDHNKRLHNFITKHFPKPQLAPREPDGDKR